MTTLSSLFDPKSIALIGASDREGSAGRAVLTNLLNSPDRKIFPVNPRKKALLGHECYPDIGSIPGHVDLAIIATPARKVPGLIEDCGKAGIGGAVIVSSGFKEMGPEGVRLEQQISGLRKRYGMRILGPNCLGFMRPVAGLNATFMDAAPPPGSIAFISQSGALGEAIIDWARDAHIGFSMFASLGSMIDIGFGDLIDFLGDDTDTRSILLYMEGVGDARRFMSAARAFALHKPIIVLKPGRFAGSAQTTRSHPDMIAGDDATYEAAFKRVGVVRVREISDLFNAAAVLGSRKLPHRPRLAIVTAAGGPAVMATDALMDLGGEPANLSPETIRVLDDILPPHWSNGNPVDVLGDADTARYAKAIDACLKDEEVDGVLVIYVPLDAAGPEDVARAVVENAKNTFKPVIAAFLGGEHVRKGRELLLRAGIPTCETPEEAAKTYANMYRYRRNLDLLYETPMELPEQKAPSKEPMKLPAAELRGIRGMRNIIIPPHPALSHEGRGNMVYPAAGLRGIIRLKAIIRKAAREGRTILTGKESRDFLASYGIPSTIPPVARTLKEAPFAAKKAGYAAVDYELVLRSKKDKDFGSVILFGMGGATAELVRDFSIGLPPLNRTLAKRLMEETKAYKLIQGYSGKTPASLPELEEILVSFSNLIVDFPEIAEIDIDPLAISRGKAFVLETRIVLEAEPIDHASQYPHLVITPYPTHLITDWKLADGTGVLFRPIKPEDESLEHEFLSTLSKETLRTRFFSAFMRLTHERLVLFCNIDYDRQLAIVAEITEKGQRKIIGVVRFYVIPDTNSGEFALLVHDRFQKHGLGRKLMEILINACKEKGYDEIIGQVLTENDKMLSLAIKLGFTKKWQPGGITNVTLRLK